MQKHLTTYYFIVASTEFFLRYEPVEEVFRERTQHYRREKKSTDFWFLSSPYFLESSQLRDIRNKMQTERKIWWVKAVGLTTVVFGVLVYFLTDILP